MKTPPNRGRRQFLCATGAIGIVSVACGGIGGTMWYFSEPQKRRRRGRLENQLVASAIPVVTTNHELEINTIPARERDKLKEWFATPCAKVEPFVRHISTETFIQRLRYCQNKEEQHRLLSVSFYGKVISPAEINVHLDTIADDVGQELDANWATCCRSIASSWQRPITGYRQQFDLGDFEQQVDKLMRDRLREVIIDAYAAVNRQTLGETFDNVGKAAMIMLPHTNVEFKPGEFNGNPAALLLAIPKLIYDALSQFFSYLLGILFDNRDELQTTLSAEIASLANQIAENFCSEIETQLAKLHDWRYESVRVAAQKLAVESVG